MALKDKYQIQDLLLGDRAKTDSRRSVGSKKKEANSHFGPSVLRKKKRIRFLGRRFELFLRFSLPNQEFFSNMVLVFIKKIVTSRSDDPLGKSMLVKHDKAHARGGRRFKRASSDGARRGSGT